MKAINHLFLTLTFLMSTQITISQPTTHSIQNGAVTLHTSIYPKQGAETIILLHGGPGVPDPMLDVVNTLKDKFQVVYFEQRGTGKSTNAEHSYTMEDYVGDVNTIAEYLDIEQFHLFGHSWGGLYAQIYANMHPGRLLSLCLCSPSSGTNKTWKQTEKEVMQFNKRTSTSDEWMQMGWLSLKGMMGSDKAYQQMFRLVMCNYHKNHPDIMVSEKQLTGVRARSVNKTRKELIKYPMLDTLNDPSFPVCVTYGEQDIYGESKQEVLDRYPTASTYLFENCGHIPWLHVPEEFKEALSVFYGMSVVM
ncbi:MAG: alpha/beta hydrolase [Flammeovirgaceae bacterium]|nr:alpha/beta hydrolase [Flammeovirgaceae bacterium]